MGCAGGKPTAYPEVSDDPNAAPAVATGAVPLQTAQTQQGLQAEDSFLSPRDHSIVGNMMRAHGPGERRFSEDYDDSDAQVMGSGMSGQVLTARSRKTCQVYAIKALRIDQMGVDGMDELMCEIEAMRRLDHPNIVKLFEIYQDFDEGVIHMVLELCTGGELVSRMIDSPQGLTEGEAARLVAKMLSALRHCHEHDVVHRDVKLDNFVYEHEGDSAELKLIDFGLSHLAQVPVRLRECRMPAPSSFGSWLRRRCVCGWV